MNQTNPAHPGGSPTLPDVQRLLDAELSLRSRLGYVALLLGSLGMAALAGALWLTEPALPFRTQVAFALMIVIGLSWTVFSVWVLRHRRVLYARQHIVAGRMAVAFTSVFVVSALAIGYGSGKDGAYAAAALGGVMLIAAVLMLLRGHRAFNRLAERRDGLARELGRST